MSVFRGERGVPTSIDMGKDLRVLDGIASWCGAVHDAMPLGDALAAIAQSIDGVAAAITRDQGGNGRTRLVAEYDVRKDAPDEVLLQRGLAEDVLGDFYNRLKAGAVCFLSDYSDEAAATHPEALKAWLRARSIQDIVVVVLEAAGLRNDYVEFHFDRTLAESDKRDIESFMPTLVRAWAGRKTGLVTRAQMDERMIRARAAVAHSRPGPEEPILGMSNPARLSRAEFRVCLLLSRGLSVKAVTDELGLSESTIRSHLCSIYSKTESAGLAELLYRLLSTTTAGFAAKRATLA